MPEPENSFRIKLRGLINTSLLVRARFCGYGDYLAALKSVKNSRNQAQRFMRCCNELHLFQSAEPTLTDRGFLSFLKPLCKLAHN